MSSLPGRRCVEAGCMEAAEKNSRCLPHSKQWTREQKPWDAFSVSRRQALPKGWASLRERILKRDNRICYICGGPGADSVDHLKPRWMGGSDKPSNLKAAHWDAPPHCHRTKSSKEGALAALEKRRREEGARKKKEGGAKVPLPQSSTEGGVQKEEGGPNKTPPTRKLVPRILQPSVLARHDGICFICGGGGSDSVALLDEALPVTATNIRPVHRKIQPKCWYEEL